MNDYRWLNKESQQFLEKDYLLPGQTVDERVDVICNAAEKILDKKGFAEKFKENFKKGWYSFSTPIWTNFGNERGLPISCYGSFLDDSLDSIAYNWAEIAMMTKHGGGTSAYFGKLRPRGAKIKDNGESSGAVHFMQTFDNLVNVVSQGSTRRGNCAVYLPIDHADIKEFLNLRTEGNPIQDLSFGVCVPDYWMEDMIAGDVEKRKIWARVLELRSSLGYPYIFFTDTANKNTVDCYKDKGLKINHSNLCVTGDQLVVTDKGIKKVVDLYKSGEKLVLFDGEKPVNASEMKLIENNADVYKITTESGRTHKVTSYHKIKTERGMIATKDLIVGDKVCIQRSKGLFGKIHDPEKAFLLGLYQADGTQYKDIVFIDLWENDFDLINEIESYVLNLYKLNDWMYYKVKFKNRTKIGYRPTTIPKFFKQTSSQNGVRKLRLQNNKLREFGFEKGFVPKWILESDEQTQSQYLRGLYYADGTVYVGKHNKGNPIQLSLANINHKFLQEIQIILSNFGINSSIRLLRKSEENILPDGKGGNKLYKTKDCFRLIISNKPDAIKFEYLTGFLTRKGVNLKDRCYRNNTKKFDTIKSIECVGKEDVYCTTVDSEEHVWVCNSFITSNCTEIFLPNNNDESFVCDLSSMNILYFDEWKDTDAVELMVYFLDAVMTEFIDKAKNIRFMERPVRFSERHRALGIGWLGWHSYLQEKMVPFESMQAKLLNTTVAKTIKESAYKASAKLAVEYGEPDVCKGYGRRNSTLLAIAPTKSSAFILGQVSEGIEPHRSNYFIKDLQKIKSTIKNPHLVKLLDKKGKNTDEIWESILKNSGSVQHLDFLDDNEKDVFKTFAEISPKEIIIQAAQRQKYIDQGQSLNLMIHPSIPVKDVNSLIIESWKLGVKSLYYQISVNAAQQFSRNVLSCKNCES